MDVQQIESLKHVRHDRPAAREIAPLTWSVEPGDATHYEVALRGEFAIVVVGNLDDHGRNGAIVHGNGSFNTIGKPSDYTIDLCAYFGHLALGLSTAEPAGLANRRR